MVIPFFKFNPKKIQKKPTLKNPFCDFGKEMGFLGLPPPPPLDYVSIYFISHNQIKYGS